MSNQHICKEATPTASKGKKNRYFPISTERLPLLSLRVFLIPKRLTFLTGYTATNARISVSRLPDSPESQV